MSPANDMALQWKLIFTWQNNNNCGCYDHFEVHRASCSLLIVEDTELPPDYPLCPEVKGRSSKCYRLSCAGDFMSGRKWEKFIDSKAISQ